jgi:hypothetical protein
MRLSIWLAVVTLGFCLNASGPNWAAGPPDRQATTEATGTRAHSDKRITPTTIAVLGISSMPNFRLEPTRSLRLVACSNDVGNQIMQARGLCIQQCRSDLQGHPIKIYNECTEHCEKEADEALKRAGC